MAEEIQVRPLKSGKWTHSETRSSFETRREAIDAARREGGAETLRVIHEDGTEEPAATPPNCRIVLIRLDGSEVGELDPAPSTGGPAQTVTLSPAVEASEGGS